MTKLSELQKKNGSISNKKVIIPFIFLPCLFINRILNNDIWFILNSGRYVINNGIPYVEPFTIHKDMTFVMQQWLTSVIFWLSYDKFGEIGILAIIFICYLLIVFTMYKLTMLISENNLFISYSFTFLFSFIINLFMISRPIIFTLLLVVLELYIMEKYIASKNNKCLLFLPIISLLLINLHSAMWPILFIILVPYVIDAYNFKIGLVSCEGYEKRYLLITILIMLLVGICNPYGIKAMTYLISSYGYSEISNYVTEMKTPNINDLLGLFIYFLIFTIFMTYCIFKNGKTKIRYILLSIGTAIMMLSSIRNLSIFIVCGIFPLAYFLKDITLKDNYEKLSLRATIIRIILLISILLILLFALNEKSETESTTETYKDLNEVIDYILKNEKKENIVLYTPYAEGSLVEFRGLPSYIDPRADVFVKKNNNKDDIMKEYVDMQNGKLYYKTVLDKYLFTHLIISNKDILNTYLPYDYGYKVIYSNETYKLFKKIN